ncbi:hypothetical protein MKZ38_001019 [Zalerion maritima]|uniref:Uncharacterized protein n=1 Tax=Zalerion maritima TaxID=339359 RepID=A0AAD5WRR0_9PEZI|nr:hypothetical protein MKZ38_001019 [Zalerion maritima]
MISETAEPGTVIYDSGERQKIHGGNDVESVSNESQGVSATGVRNLLEDDDKSVPPTDSSNRPPSTLGPIQEADMTTTKQTGDEARLTTKPLPGRNGKTGTTPLHADFERNLKAAVAQDTKPKPKPKAKGRGDGKGGKASSLYSAFSISVKSQKSASSVITFSSQVSNRDPDPVGMVLGTMGGWLGEGLGVVEKSEKGSGKGKVKKKKKDERNEKEEIVWMFIHAATALKMDVELYAGILGEEKGGDEREEEVHTAPIG